MSAQVTEENMATKIEAVPVPVLRNLGTRPPFTTRSYKLYPYTQMPSENYQEEEY